MEPELPTMPILPGDAPLRSIYADDDMIAEILPAFVHNMPKYVEQLRTLVGRREWSAAAKVCHDLKGTSGGYGYPQIGALAHQLEVEIKGSCQLPLIEQYLHAVTKLCEQAILGLQH